MTTDNFTDAARAEAERRADLSAEPLDFEHGLIVKDFLAGAEWARTHLAAQEPTDVDIPKSVANLIRDLTDPDDCWFDHSGGCQAHGYLDLTPEQECPHSEAKRLLAARAARRDEERQT